MDKNRFKLNNLLKSQSSIQKFVINLSTDNSSSDSENEPNQKSNSITSETVEDVPINNQNSTNLPQNDSNSLISSNQSTLVNQSNKTENERINKHIDCKIQTPTTKTTLDKKRQINSLKIRLQETDQHYGRLKKLINKKNLNVQQMKAKIVQNQLMLRKQQFQVKKLYASYISATKEMKENLKQITTMNNSLSAIQKGVDTDKKMMMALENKSKNIEKLIENEQSCSDNQSSINQFSLSNKESNEDGDSMSIASSDELVNLILEHNDTSINRQDCLFVQSSSDKEIIWLDEPINKIEVIDSRYRNTIKKPIISSALLEAKQLDDNRISRIIDLKLDYTRKSSAQKIPTKITNRKKENNLGVQSPLIKKKPINKKKNALLKKMLMIEERNEKDEIERSKKEEKNKIKLMNEKKEKDINDLRKMLKNKQILSNAIIGLKKDICNLLKLNDKIENYDLFMNGLSLFLENSLDKSYLLDDLTIQIDNKLFDKNLNHSKKQLSTNSESTQVNLSLDSDLEHQIYSNNLVQQSTDQPNKKLSTPSVLESIRAYRLSNNFEEKYIRKNNQDFTMIVDSFFANKINPYSTTCNFDLHGKCNDDNCCSQHKKDFLLDRRQKAIDLLLYNPSITRYKGEVKTKEDMNKLLNHLNEFVDNLEKKYSYNEMIKYLVKLIRFSEDDESIIVKTKVQMQQTENTTINEFISSQQQTYQIENTFPDYNYNFKIRDRKNVLTYSKLLNSTKSNEHQHVVEEDYENKYERRFFNFNSINVSLEEYCQENPTDIKGWIKLVYLQFNTINCKRPLKKQQLHNAVKVVVKALNSNRTSLELWKTYLYLLINLLNNKLESESYDKTEKQLQFICKKIIEKYPSYELWKFYLSLSLNYLNKELISSEILDEIQSNNILYYDVNNDRNATLISNAYLEMVLYKVNLYIEIHKIEKAKIYLASVLSSSIQPVTMAIVNEFIKTLFTTDEYSTFEDRKKYQETSLLSNEDKVFLWLNYLYLVCFNKLPSEKFEQFKQGFSTLIDKKPFLITFNSIKKATLDKLLGILIEAIKDCFFNIESNLMNYHVHAQQQIKQQMHQQNLITCLPLFHNLANLFYSVGKKKAAIQVFNSLSTEDNQILIPFLINKAIFEEKNSYDNECFYTLGDTHVYKQDNFDVIYYLCMFHFKHGEFKYFNYEASKILTWFFDFDRSISISVSFKKLLYRKLELDVEKQRLLEKVDSKLWTLYLISEILASSEENMDSVLSNSISLSKINKNTKTHTINLLHFLYLNFYAKTITDQEKLDEFLEKVKYACLFIEDQQFQFYLLKHFSNCFFSVQQRFKFFLKFLILLPQNKYILNHFLNLAFNEMNSKKICFQVLNYFIDRKKLRNLLEPVHWYMIIYHYYFQLAISNYPYNKQLWHYLLAYEISQNHLEHCTLIRSILKMSKIPDLKKSFSFD